MTQLTAMTAMTQRIQSACYCSRETEEKSATTGCNHWELGDHDRRG